MSSLKSVLSLVFLYLGGASLSHADFVAEEPVEDLWRISYVTDTSIHTSVNGQITHGDELHVRLIKGNCEIGNLFTFVYTHSNHPDIEQLEGEFIQSSFMGNDMIVKVLYVSPFLMGHRATIDLGWASVEQLKGILGSENPIKIKFINSSVHKITEYFDIVENWWSSEGLSDSVNRAVDMCNTLVE